MIDLTILAADKNMQFALHGALNRPQAMGIREITFEITTHPERDGGMRTTRPLLLGLKRPRAKHGLLIFDYDGCGAKEPADELQARMDERLRPQWAANAKTVVVSPELDIWLWGGENALREVLEWKKGGRIRDWLKKRGFCFAQTGKPERPKEAMDAIMRELRVPRSSALYEKIAQKISLKRCVDPAFLCLKKQLQAWFPPPVSEGTDNQFSEEPKNYRPMNKS